MNTINRGLWVNETNDAYEMRVKNSCFNARANVRKRPCKIVVFYRTVNIIIARPINFLVFLLACVRSLWLPPEGGFLVRFLSGNVSELGSIGVYG